MPADPILVYEFHDAPQEFQDLSPHGGDEDWLAVMPAVMVAKDRWIPWLEDGYGGFGVSSVSQHMLPDGRKVFIGAHS